MRSVWLRTEISYRRGVVQRIFTIQAILKFNIRGYLAVVFFNRDYQNYRRFFLIAIKKVLF